MENFRGFRDVQTATNQSHEQMLEHVETILDKQVNMGSNFSCLFFIFQRFLFLVFVSGSKKNLGCLVFTIIRNYILISLFILL